MKKLLSLAMAISLFVNAGAQDLDQINDLMAKSKFKEAKTGIDKYLLNPKKANDAEGWYYKGRVYNSLSHDSTVPQSDLFQLRNDAYNAFKQNQLLDPADIYMKLETYNSYLDLYFGFYDLGAKEFNSKNFNGALESFKKSNEVKDFILAKKYTYAQITLYPLDTALVLNTAASAVQAKKEDEAVVYYRKLTDANVSGKDYLEIYEYLVDYYNRKEDQANLQAMLAKAKSYYPENEFWYDVEIRNAKKSGDQALLLAKYEELLKQNPKNFTLSYNYGIELYNGLYGKEAKTGDNTEAKQKLTGVLQQAIDNEPNGDVTATVMMANHLFNVAADELNTSNMIKSTKPEDVKKKADMKTQAHKTMDECIKYAESAEKHYDGLPKLTGGQKANYKIMIGYLGDIYSLKNNKAKIAEYEKKNAESDKKL
jgi:hypothetical protein